MNGYDVIVCKKCGELIGKKTPDGFIIGNFILPSSSQFNINLIEFKCLICGEQTYVRLEGTIVPLPTDES